MPEACQRNRARKRKFEAICCRLRGPGRKQEETRREKLFANHFRRESARQTKLPGVAGERELAQGFELGEVERQAGWTAETAQNAPLQSERLRLPRHSPDR